MGPNAVTQLWKESLTQSLRCIERIACDNRGIEWSAAAGTSRRWEEAGRTFPRAYRWENSTVDICNSDIYHPEIWDNKPILFYDN